MIRLRFPRIDNCLFWAWWRYRTKGGYYIKRRGKRGLFAHRLWSRDLKHFWGYTVGPEGLWKTASAETLAAFCYPGRVIEETPQHSPEHRIHHGLHEIGPALRYHPRLTHRFHRFRRLEIG